LSRWFVVVVRPRDLMLFGGDADAVALQTGDQADVR